MGLALACGGKTPLDSAHDDWAGDWVARDGTHLTVYLNGGGSYEGSNTSITGGHAVFEGEDIVIGLGPIKKTFHIDAPPSTDGTVWTVTLDGIVYTRN